MGISGGIIMPTTDLPGKYHFHGSFPTRITWRLRAIYD